MNMCFFRMEILESRKFFFFFNQILLMEIFDKGKKNLRKKDND